MTPESKAVELLNYLRMIKEKSIRIDKKNSDICQMVSPVEAHVILTCAAKKHCVMSQLAKSLSLSLGSVTSIIDKLEKRKLVVRTRCDKDRRKIYIHLTKEGKKLYALVQKAHLQFTRSMLQELSNQEQNLLLKLLRKISNKISEE